MLPNDLASEFARPYYYQYNDFNYRQGKFKQLHDESKTSYDTWMKESYHLMNEVIERVRSLGEVLKMVGGGFWIATLISGLGVGVAHLIGYQLGRLTIVPLTLLKVAVSLGVVGFVASKVATWVNRDYFRMKLEQAGSWPIFDSVISGDLNRVIYECKKFKHSINRKHEEMHKHEKSFCFIKDCEIIMFYMDLKKLVKLNHQLLACKQYLMLTSIQKIHPKNLNSASLKVIEQKNKIFNSLVLGSEDSATWKWKNTLYSLEKDQKINYQHKMSQWPDFIKYKTSKVFDIFEKKLGDKFQEACLKAWKFDDKNQLTLSEDPVVGFAEYIIKESLGLDYNELDNKEFSDYTTWLLKQSH